MWWHPDKFLGKIDNLKARAQVIAEVRAFFKARGYLEVDTPALQPVPCMEAHLQAFETSWQDERLFLHTSPEFAMKKLLVAGLPKIFQLAKTFRNEPASKLHSPEFTLLEWYSAGMNYTEMMQETINLIRAVSPKVIKWQNRVCDLEQPWEILSVSQAMKKYAKIDIEPVLDDVAGLRALAHQLGLKTNESDRWDDVFFRIFLEKVEPHLGESVPSVIYDYPISMAALSRPKPEDPRFAERFEVYICGVELCNAFGELTDADIQRQRFETDVQLRKKLYGQDYPIDYDFLRALDYGLPLSSGNALGIDRLVMLITGADSIDQVQAAPVQTFHQ